MKWRNPCGTGREPCTSPPSRGAWIEMFCRGRIRLRLWGRPPRGGRGLKYTIPPKNTAHIRVAPLAGGVD